MASTKSVSILPAEKYTISINGRKIRAQRSATLLDVLAKNGVYLPASCGGRGSCASCKCHILTPPLPYNFKELPYLSEFEQKKGIHLSCQTQVHDDMELEVDEQVLQAQSIPARVSGLEFVDDVYALLTLQSNGNDMNFTAGQFALIEAFDEATGQHIRRAYSFIGSPQNPQELSFLVALKKGGALSTFLREKAKPDTLFTVSGPYGQFSSFADAKHELWIAGKSGIAPFFSMLADMRDQGNAARKTSLLYRGTGIADSVLTKKIRQFQNENTAFAFFDAPHEFGDMPLSKRLENFLANAASIPDRVLLCASATEIDSCVNVLLRAGIPSNAIRRDAF